MATPISKTIGECFALSGGKSCKAVYDFIEATYPGWTEDTVIDVLEWTEGLRALGQSSAVNYGLYRGLTNAQAKQFINWVLNQFISHTPDAYARKAAMITLKEDLADYISAPTNPKKAALLAKAKAIKPSTDSHAELYVANAFKGITVAVANNAVTGDVLNELGHCLTRAGHLVGGLTILQVNNAILTRLQTILGVID
jgi:hypothetical protein